VIDPIAQGVWVFPGVCFFFFAARGPGSGAPPIALHQLAQTFSSFFCLLFPRPTPERKSLGVLRHTDSLRNYFR